MNTLSDFSAFLKTQTFPLYLKIKVIPNAKKTEVSELMKNATWKIRVSAPANEGKANTELKKFFQKAFKQKVDIINGEKSREKLIKIS